MTPKEKAIEIYTKMYNEVYASYGTDFLAKQCALIAVNEVVDQWFGIDTYLANGQGELNPNYKYWLEVKQEIEKL
jgi:hypothetical protein